MLSLHFTMVPVPMNTELQVWVGSLGFKKKKATSSQCAYSLVGSMWLARCYQILAGISLDVLASQSRFLG